MLALDMRIAGLVLGVVAVVLLVTAGWFLVQALTEQTGLVEKVALSVAAVGLALVAARLRTFTRRPSGADRAI